MQPSERAASLRLGSVAARNGLSRGTRHVLAPASCSIAASWTQRRTSSCEPTWPKARTGALEPQRPRGHRASWLFETRADHSRARRSMSDLGRRRRWSNRSIGIPRWCPIVAAITAPVSHNHAQPTARVFHRVLTTTPREFPACRSVGRRAAALWSPSSRRDFDARNIGNGPP